MTLRQWLAKAGADLNAGPHPDRARLDAEALLLHHLGKNRAWLLTHLDEDFAGCGAIGYAAMLRRRLAGEPIQYITGEAGFHGLELRVTPAVLIPRPETEHLVETAIGLAAGFTAPRILDVGTGSGAIAIALALNLPHARVFATDLSAAALAVARENARHYRATIGFLQGDLLSPAAGKAFDIIVSNPPYVADADRESLSVEVRDFEPAQALFAGPDGMAVYRRLIPSAFAALVPGGFIALEIGCGQQSPVQEILAASGFTGIRATPDLRGILRVLSAQRAIK